MPFDTLTIAVIRRELEEKVAGGRVQNLLMPGPLTLSLEIYRPGTGRTHLLMSAHPQNARIHLIAANPTRDPSEHPPLLLLLRKYVRGGTIQSVSQPPYERVIELSIAKRLPPDKHQEYRSEWDFRGPTLGDDEDDGVEEAPQPDWPIRTVSLFVEIMGRLSNIVLVDEGGTILDAIKRIPPSLSRYRSILPHQPYVPPPPQDKRDPLRASISTLSLEMSKVSGAEPDAPAWRGLVNGFVGLSPTLAREVVFEALGSLDRRADDVARDPDLLGQVLDAMRSMFLRSPADWTPLLAFQGSGPERHPVEFAPYPLSHLQAKGAAVEPFHSMSAAVETYYRGVQSVVGHAALRGQILATLEEMRKRESRRLSSLSQELEAAERAEELRKKGEGILAYIHTITAGQKELLVPEEQLHIALDPGLSPVENAQAYFRDYRKARSAQEGLPERLQHAQMQVDYVDGLITSLELATTYDDIRAVQAEAQAASRRTPGQPPAQQARGKKPRKQQEKVPQPLRLKTSGGAQVLVGRTASQNDTATFRLASPEDLWFHARGVPGSHVILRVAGGISQSDIDEAAAIAAGYSKLRNEARVDVLCTERRYVRRIPDAPPGLVTYRNEQVVRVAPRASANRREGNPD